MRLRKGCADRVFEEIVYALVGERIGGEDDESIENSNGGGGKVNGVVLSVRKEEDILSLWCAPTSRGQRDLIRDSIRLAVEPLLSPVALAGLILDFKPHPPANSSSHSVGSLSTPHKEHHSRQHRSNNPHDRDSPRGERGERGERGDRGDHNTTTNDRRDRPSRTGGFGQSRVDERANERGSSTPGGTAGERSETGGYIPRESFGGGRPMRAGNGTSEPKERSNPRSWGRTA
jgi:hypothetical protein